MILVTGHDKQMDPCACLVNHIEKITDDALENINRFCNTDIIHSLWIVGAKTCTHAACQKNSGNLAGTDCFQSGFGKVFCILRNLRECHCLDRRDRTACLLTLTGGDLLRHRKICFLNLLQKCGFLCIRKCIIILQHMLLMVLC